MDISLNKTQLDIAKEARRFLKKECPMEFVKEMVEDERGFTEEIWKKMAEMDWMAMRIPESHGGIGMDQIDLNMILEEMGRTVFPGPFFSTISLAAEAIIASGTDEQKDRYLPEIANGNLRGTLALNEQDSGADTGYIQMEARADGDDFVLTGTKISVPDAHVADFLICAARTQRGSDLKEGVTLFLVDPLEPGVSVSLLPTMDGTRKLCVVEFKGVRLGKESVLGELNVGWKTLQPVLQRAQIGLSAECVGGAERVMEIATDYAKIRVQFNQPIGTFQAVKHRCAQMYVEDESARSLLYWGAWAQDHGDEKEAAIAASAVKSYCSETFTRNAASAIQILGGTGFTMECDVHFYLKRAKGNEIALGDPPFHREQIMRLLNGGFF
ncbi:MAG: acyl-CoA dehydrogenase family protein [Desulfobacterales bacterium]